MAKITDIHIQDKVRFLDSVGEGIVVKIDTKQNLVYVQDEDGFDIPMPAQQIVVIAASPIQHERETTLPSEGDKKSKEEGTAHIAHTAAKGKKEAKKDTSLRLICILHNWLTIGNTCNEERYWNSNYLPSIRPCATI
jgi:hypothetical protein